MESAPGASAAARNGGVSLPPPMSSTSSSQPSRKEWRAVPEQSVRNSGNELERSKLGQSEERLIYEQGLHAMAKHTEELQNMEQRLHEMAKQREELQNMELELRAQVIVRSECSRLQNTFEAQIKKHENATVKLQEQLHEKKQKIHELERRMDEKERELHAIRLDNEAAWAKEGLLREQNKELQSYRMERDSTEAERAQHIKQIHDLQEHIQEKERQFIELQDQHRIAQETIIFKDEQIREGQAWMTRAQEMDALQSTTNHNLQAELRERTEQYNQLWLGCQRQFAEMERLHLHMQQLQLELAEAREKSGSNSDGTHVNHTNTNDASRLGQINGSQLEVSENNSHSDNTTIIQNGSSETLGGNTLTQAEHAQSVAFAPPSLFGMPYLPTALHPFVMHQQGVPHPSHVSQSHFHSVPVQNWQSQQAQPDGEHAPAHNQYHEEQTEESMFRTDPHYNFQASADGQVLHANYVDGKVSQGLDASVVPSPNGERQVHGSIDESRDNDLSQQNLQNVTSQFHDALRLDHPLDNVNDTKEKNNPVMDHGTDNKITMVENTNFAINASPTEPPTDAVNYSGTTSNTSSTNTFASTGQRSNTAVKPVESYLLDERALLASIARTIGSGGRIRISSTLPNRLGKMLAPLHWHDYKKKYGKLDDFVASHSDLFLIEEDFIQLREGAQEIIAATAAVAKVAAAAAAAPSSYSSLMPSVALTPMAQSRRLKKSQNLNGGSYHVGGGASNVKILGKSNDQGHLNGSETRPGVSLVGKQQSRATSAAASSPRR